MTKIGSSLATLALALGACGRSIPRQAASDQVRDILEVDRAQTLSVSPGGELWICAMDGRSYVSRDWNQTWCQTILPKHAEIGRSSLLFFDERRWLLSGLVEADETSTLLTTEDAGLNWSSVSLPSKGQILVVQPGKNGALWAASESGSLLASTDFGRSWRASTDPFVSSGRNAFAPTIGVSSFYFLTGDEAYAGSSWNGLKRTSDGGKTWSSLPTPADELCPPNPETTEDGPHESQLMTGKDGRSSWRSFHSDQISALSNLWVFGDWLLASQCEQLFVRPLSARRGWRLVEVDGHAVELAALDGERLAVVTDDGRIALLSQDLRPLATSPPSVPDRPRAIATCSRGVVVLAGVVGQVCSVCTWTEGRLECSHLHTAGPSHEWRIDSFDRTRDGTLYGVTASALYRSRDSGTTWDLLAEGKYLSSVHAHIDGDSVLVQDEDGWFEWSKAQPSLRPLDARLSPSAESSIVARRGKLWMAVGLETKDNASREMLFTSDIVPAGPGFTVTIFASVDDGHSWKSIDRYDGATLQAHWLSRDNTLTLCMSDGALRRGRIDDTSGLLLGKGMEVIDPPPGRVCGQYGSWIVFPEPDIGWSGGYHFFGGIDTYHSEDGGRTWEEAETVEDRHMKTFLLGGGGCVRMAGGYSQPSRLDIWRDGKFEQLCSLEYGPHDAHIDSTGALLVRLDNGDVWSLDMNGRDWKKIGNIEFPR